MPSRRFPRFGGGHEGIFGKTTRVERNGRRIDPARLVKLRGRAGYPTAFLIPAQRVLVLQDGWPKPFMAYGVGDPYAIRKFSESIRTLMVQWSGHDLQELILVPDLRIVIDAAIYGESTLDVTREGMRQHIVL